MQFAILGLSAVGAVTGVASLVIMLKTAKKLDTFSKKVKQDVNGVKSKVTHNAAVIKTALGQLEL
jgi:hypothetical protein